MRKKMLFLLKKTIRPVPLLLLGLLFWGMLFTIQHLLLAEQPNSSLLKYVAAIGDSKTTEQTEEFVIRGITMSMEEEELLHILGKPKRIDLSEYGFMWYVYHQNYKNYLQVGVLEEKVVALYTNSVDWLAASGICFGSTKKEVEQTYGLPLTKIKKGKTIFNFQDSGQEYGLYLQGNVYATLFYDVHENHTVTAIQLIDKDTELAFKSFYGEPSEELRLSFERQTFDLVNATRVRSGQQALTWDEQAASTARKHSIDMAQRQFFEHTNPDGLSPFDRLKANGISYKLASENVAAGQTSAIFAHESWMNSWRHRQNILGDFNRLGVGIYFGGIFEVYYTQNFYQS